MQPGKTIDEQYEERPFPAQKTENDRDKLKTI